MAQSKLDPRYTFIVDYDDPQAGLTRKYQLMYYLSDHTIEMFDAKNRRMFLKRCKYPSLSVEDLFLGATVVVYSRQLKVSEYGDEYTAAAFQEKSESALGIVTPAGYQNLGTIIKQVNGAGMRIMAMNMVQLAPEEAAEFFSADAGRAEYRTTVASLTEYPVILLHMVGQTPPANIDNFLVWAGRQAVDFFFGAGSSISSRNNAALSNCALCLIKPHAIHAGHGGDIVSAILQEGFEISAITVSHVTQQDAAEFLEVYKGVVPEYNGLVEHITSGPVWALEIRAENAVQAFRHLCGPFDPEIARVLRPDSLRAHYGVDKVRNAVHCTDLPEDGPLEVEFFFRTLFAAHQS